MTSEQNPRSGAVHNLNFNSPIAGGADLRLDFELANDSDTPPESAFLQFVTWPSRCSSPATWARRGQIRLRMRADNIRTVRLEILSPSYADPEGGDRYGWSLLASQSAQDYVLDVSALTLSDDSRQGPVPVAHILDGALGPGLQPRRPRSQRGRPLARRQRRRGLRADRRHHLRVELIVPIGGRPVRVPVPVCVPVPVPEAIRGSWRRPPGSAADRAKAAPGVPIATFPGTGTGTHTGTGTENGNA